MVLETLLDPERKKQRGPLQVKDATPLEEAKPSALPAKDAAQLAWERVDAELVRLLDQLRAEARREREAEEERVRIRQAAEKGVRLEAKLQPKFHLTRVGPRPGLSDLPAVAIPIAHRKRLAPPPPPPPAQPPASQPAAAAPAQRALAAAAASAPSAWDSAESDAADGAAQGGASRVRQLLSVIRSDVALLFTYVTAAKLRRMIAIESAHLTWIRFLLALLALLLFVPSDTPVSPQADTQRMLRLILLALLLMHTQQLLLNFASLSSYRRTMQASSVASAASFALLWLMAALLLPYSSPRLPASATGTVTTPSTATSSSTASGSPPSDTRAASAP